MLLLPNSNIKCWRTSDNETHWDLNPADELSSLNASSKFTHYSFLLMASGVKEPGRDPGLGSQLVLLSPFSAQK